MMRRNVAIFTLVAACALGTTVAARNADAADASTATGAGSTLSPAEVVRKIEAAGYTDVRDVEYDDGRWEADATDAKGVRVDVELDPATGKVELDRD